MRFTKDAYHVVQALEPAADAAGRSSQYISLKGTGKVLVVVQVAQGAANTVAITLQQATVVAGTDTKAIEANVPIWANEDTATNDTLTAQTAAKAFTTSAAQKNKLVVFEVDPALILDHAGGFDCLGFTTGASDAGNITAGVFVLGDLRYAPAGSAVTD